MKNSTTNTHIHQTLNICNFLLNVIATHSGCAADHCNVLISASALYASMGSVIGFGMCVRSHISA